LEELMSKKAVAVTGVQTDLGGEQIEKHIKQNEIQKEKLEDVLPKLNELAAELQKRSLQDLIGKVGLQKYVRTPTLSERLHNDAALRAERRERLQEEAAESRLIDYVTDESPQGLAEAGMQQEVVGASLVERESAYAGRAESVEVVTGCSKREGEEVAVGASETHSAEHQLVQDSPRLRLPPIPSPKVLQEETQCEKEQLAEKSEEYLAMQIFPPAKAFCSPTRPGDRRKQPQSSRLALLRLSSPLCRGRAAGPADLWPPGSSRRGIVSLS